MEPNQLNTPNPLDISAAATDSTEATAETSAVPAESSTGAESPATAAAPGPIQSPFVFTKQYLLHAPASHVLLGTLLLSVSIVGGISLLSSLVPMGEVATQESARQVAAAALAERKSNFDNLTLEARGAYVYDAARDEELYAANASLQLPLASITKVMLVLTVAEALPLDSHITISREAVERGGGGLTWGEEWVVKDLINFTLMTSSNTGAEALSEAAAPLIATKYPEAPQGSATVWRMNQRAQELGMHETYFLNATGLDESVTQAGALSSARDIATLFSYILRTNRDLFAGTALQTISVSPINFEQREAHNTNYALPNIEGLIMGKTGTTDLAGGNLAIAFNATSSHPVIVVVLNSSPMGRYTDIENLVARARSAVGGR